MYYLTFMLPDVVRLLEAHGFAVAVPNVRFERPFHMLRLVVATRQ
jgi:hypothetical protein